MRPPSPASVLDGGPPRLPRRRLLQLGLAAGATLMLPPLLAGCGRGDGPLLLAAEGGLPAAWLKELPGPWRQQLLESPQAVLAAAGLAPGAAVPGLAAGLGLVALADGWASALPLPGWQPFGAPALLARLMAAAQPVARLFQPPTAPALAFPWAFSPWVLVLRSQPELARRARGPEGWQVLLDPALRGQLVLPASPRVTIELCGADPHRLRQLRAQALAYDDQHALHLLRSGEARAAVVPLQPLIPLLRRDQRLEVVLPASGAPLSWQLLLRPKGAPEAPPLEWLGALLEPSLLPKVLAAGWVPPLPRAQLEPALQRLPRSVAQLLLPPEPVLERCWSLPPLDPTRRQQFQALWDGAAPR